jgi:hypothetical protein
MNSNLFFIFVAVNGKGSAFVLFEKKLKFLLAGKKFPFAQRQSNYLARDKNIQKSYFP